jgi:CBS domain-containing protein
MTLVGEVLKRKGRDVFTVSHDASVKQALELMARKDVGALVVMRGQFLVGIFSERDYAREVVSTGKNSMNIPVQEFMTDWVYAVGPSEDAETCLALMNECHIRHLPVVDGEQVVGLVSIGDLVKIMLPKSLQDLDVERFIFSRPD